MILSPRAPRRGGHIDRADRQRTTPTLPSCQPGPRHAPLTHGTPLRCSPTTPGFAAATRFEVRCSHTARGRGISFPPSPEFCTPSQPATRCVTVGPVDASLTWQQLLQRPRHSMRPDAHFAVTRIPQIASSNSQEDKSNCLSGLRVFRRTGALQQATHAPTELDTRLPSCTHAPPQSESFRLGVPLQRS